MNFCPPKPGFTDITTTKSRSSAMASSAEAGLAVRRGDAQLQSAPLADGELDFAPVFPLPTPAQKRTITAMKESVVAIATELDIPEGLLCARRHLETLVFDGIWPDALDGWRKTLLFDALMGKL